MEQLVKVVEILSLHLRESFAVVFKHRTFYRFSGLQLFKYATGQDAVHLSCDNIKCNRYNIATRTCD